jgi:hypothetical protein
MPNLDQPDSTRFRNDLALKKLTDACQQKLAWAESSPKAPASLPGASMAQSDSKPTNSNVVDIRSDVESVRANIAALRTSVVVAWRERGVMLTRDEQKALRDEIAETCELLLDLTKPGV